MKKTLFIFTIVGLAFSSKLFAQTKAEGQISFRDNTFDTYIIRVDSYSLQKISLIQNTDGYKHSEFTMENAVNYNDSDFFFTNAGISSPNCSAGGLLINNGKTLHPLNLRSSPPTQPQGLLLLTQNEAFIVNASSSTSLSNVITGVQSGPMLVISGNYNELLSKTPEAPKLRCGVGIFKINTETFLVFAISNEPVTFTNFAELFKEHYKCTDALCLESGNCAMYLPYIDRKNLTDDKVICNYIFYGRR